MSKIAFLFLTLDNVNFPELWEKYFRNNENRISIYCHAKYPDKVIVPWLKNNLISNLVETGWGYIVNAIYQLLVAALEDKQNIKFITISESCVPIRKFDELYKMLMSDNPRTSYIKFMKIKNYDYSARIRNQEGYKKYKFYKHYARYCLSRHHVKKLLLRKTDINFFIKMHVGDEFVLSLLEPFKNVKDFMITYDNWELIENKRKELNKKIRMLYEKLEKKIDNKELIKNKIKELQEIRDNISKNPYAYEEVNIEDLNKAKMTEAFFWRKFPKNSNIMELKNKLF